MEKFLVIESHVELLKNMYVGWQDAEYGAPEIDPKRPYGNSDVEEDICEILKFSKSSCRNCESTYTEDQVQYAASLHKDMKKVLQILVQHPTDFKIGEYQSKDGWAWELKE